MREVRPLLDAEGADVADRGGEPWEGFERFYGCEKVGQVFIGARVDAALLPDETEALQHRGNIAICLRHTLRVSPFRVFRVKVKGYGEHVSASGSSRTASSW